MAQCKWCGKKEFFLKLSVNGLCERCNPMIVDSINENAKKYKKSIIKLMYFISPKEGLELIRTLKSSLNLLKEYEEKEIPTTKPLPSELLKQKIYGSHDESLELAERRMVDENNYFNIGVLNLDCNLYGLGVVELKGNFTYDERMDGFVQINSEEPNPNMAKWCHYEKQVISFSQDFDSGYYREYYASGKLRREVPFIKEPNSRNLWIHGTEKIFYEDLDSQGQETYTILEENLFENGERCGVWKKYSIDGGLMEEENYNTKTDTHRGTYGLESREFYPASGKLKLEEHKDWGKEYYENGDLKAEWSNDNFLKKGRYTSYYENGQIEMTVNYNDEANRDGMMQKYFCNGEVKELWSYKNGKRQYVKKFYESGGIKTEWLYDENGNEISKKYYDTNGRLLKK